MADCQLLLFEVAGERLAVRSSQVRQVWQSRLAAKSAQSVALAQALDLAPGSTRPSYEVAVRTPAGTAIFGIDRARDILAVAEEQLVPLPPLLRPLAMPCIKEGLIVDGSVVLVLDLCSLAATLWSAPADT